MRGHIFRGTFLLALAAGVAGSASCTMREGEGNSFLIVESLRASSGAEEGEATTNLQSDVSTEGSPIEDEGLVSFRLGLKDPLSPTSPNNFVTVNRYRVTYIRADGRNVQGRDVPFSFDGAFTVTVGDGSTEATFSLVRVQAKLEPPLLGLRNLGGAAVISTIAEVTFFGQDQTGRAVSVVGRISIDFADFADPD
ncbi:MAG: hypothetical protein WD690_05255 [Vicinamibacterales bacterium]